MKGLAIAEEFFIEWGLPFLKKEFPELSGRIAAGRFSGSDVLGGDDEISRDHNWGPQFTVYLSEDDFVKHGSIVADRMNAEAPNPWKGYRLAGGGDKSVHVVNIPEWFRKNFGSSQPPLEPGAWPGAISDTGRMSFSPVESFLYFLRHGALWMDGSGEMTKWREALNEYPGDILRARLADETRLAWHYGEYNFIQRIAKRRDPISIGICLGEFTTAVMRCILLMNRDFSPYWKWLAFEFRKLPEAAEYTNLLDTLMQSSDIDEQARLVKNICELLHNHLIDSNYVSGKGGNIWLLPLMNDSIELQKNKKELESLEQKKRPLSSDWKAVAGEWYRDDIGRIVGEAGGDGYIYCVTPHPDNFRITATMRAAEGNEISLWICGSTEKTESDGYTFAISNQQAKLQRMCKDVLSTKSTRISPDTEYVLAVERRDGTLRGYLNASNMPFIEWTDAEPLTGEEHRIWGFYTWNGTVVISDYKVEFLD